jgi:hypothetical protein
VPIREDRTPAKPHSEQAEILALKMLQYLLGDEERAAGFLGTTGCSPDDLRTRMNELDFLGGIIDYMLGREDLLTEFCLQQAVEPTLPLRLRAALP